MAPRSETPPLMTTTSMWAPAHRKPGALPRVLRWVVLQVLLYVLLQVLLQVP